MMRLAVTLVALAAAATPAASMHPHVPTDRIAGATADASDAGPGDPRLILEDCT